MPVAITNDNKYLFVWEETTPHVVHIERDRPDSCDDVTSCQVHDENMKSGVKSSGQHDACDAHFHRCISVHILIIGTATSSVMSW